MKTSFIYILVSILLVTLQNQVSAQGKSDSATNKNSDKLIQVEVKESKALEDKPEVVGNKVKVELKQNNNKTIMTTQNFDGETIETELEADEVEELEIDVNQEDLNENTSNKLKIKSNNRGGLNIFESIFIAKTNYPLSIDSSTNELTVTTPKGSKVVTILPDQAISNMLRRGVLDTVDASKSGEPIDEDTTQTPEPDNSGTESAESTESADVNNEDDSVLLTTNDEGELVYQVKGKKSKRLFGIIPVKINKQVEISAETGEVTKEEIPTIGSKILNVLSF